MGIFVFFFRNHQICNFFKWLNLLNSYILLTMYDIYFTIHYNLACALFQPLRHLNVIKIGNSKKLACHCLLSLVLITPPFLAYGTNIDAAAEYQEAGLYTDALSLYQKELTLLNDQSNEHLALKMRLHFRIAQTLLAMEKPLEALEEITKNIVIFYPTLKTESSLNDMASLNKQVGLEKDDDEIQRSLADSIYLSALINKALKQYAIAAQLFSLYLKTQHTQSPRNPQPTSLSNIDTNALSIHSHYDKALFEIALMDFLQGKYDTAKQQFQRLQDSTFDLKNLSKLYIARIRLIEGQENDALLILNQTSSHILPENPLYFELNYLLGDAYFQANDYIKAIPHFEKAFPQHGKEKCLWYRDTIEKITLSQSHLYLERAKRLNDSEMYKLANDLLSNQDLFNSNSAKIYSMLLRAKSDPSYTTRHQLYRTMQQTLTPLPDEWYFANGLNDFEQAEMLIKSGPSKESYDLFFTAAEAFKKAFEINSSLGNHNFKDAAEALKYQALATSHINDIEGLLNAYKLMDTLITAYPHLWNAMEYPDEALYLRGYFASSIAIASTDDNRSTDLNPKTQIDESLQFRTIYRSLAEKSLKAAANHPNNKYGDISLQHLITMYYLQGDYASTKSTCEQIVNQCPNSFLCGDAYYWLACCIKASQPEMTPHMNSEYRKYLRKVFEDFPNSPHAPEAYFKFYTYQEYLQGDRQAIKHLQNLSEKYPDSPHLIETYYLLGLDCKRDRKTPEGKWIRKKNLTDAIDSFQKAEASFDHIIAIAPSNFTPEQLSYYINVRYRATLELAMANLAISEESQGAKKQIYLQYAESVFRQLINEFQIKDHPYTKILISVDSYPIIYQESIYYFTMTQLKKHDDLQAEKILAENISRYHDAKIFRAHYLSLSLYEQGNIAMRRKEFILALDKYKQAEEAAKNTLTTEQKLDLWIQESYCYRGLHQYDQAILILSKVINDNAISSLRLKAMFLRAETYELSQRPELARKQLESLAKKGDSQSLNPWVLKAKQKLEEEHGY